MRVDKLGQGLRRYLILAVVIVGTASLCEAFVQPASASTKHRAGAYPAATSALRTTAERFFGQIGIASERMATRRESARKAKGDNKVLDGAATIEEREHLRGEMPATCHTIALSC